MKFGIGQSVLRKEDKRLVTGTGSFLGDHMPSGTLEAVIVRSPLAHGAITATDIAAASAAPGVHAVLTGADYAADELGGMTSHTFLPGMHGGPPINPSYVPLAVDRVLYVGAAVAVVVADTKAQAADAAGLVEVTYDDRPTMITIDQAMAGDAAQIWDGTRQNVAFTIDLGNAEKTSAAIDGAAHVTRLTLINNRISANSMEMRGALAQFEPYNGQLTLQTSTQVPHGVRAVVAHALKLPENAVRVIARDVGGGFGMKGGAYPEDVLIAWAAMRTGRPVVWRADRSESLQSDFHGRDQQVTAALAFDADGHITGLEVDSIHNLGAFASSGAGVSPMFAATLATGVYRVPVAHAVSRGVFTNTSPTQPYRGAGRPEASYLIERLIDQAAREMAIDRVALRRRNLVAAHEMPYQTALTYTYDCGDFEGVMDAALECADWRGFEARRTTAAAAGKLRGIGIAVHVENAGLGNDLATIRFDPSGNVTILAGTFSHGQGHETVYAQMVTDWLGVPFDRIRFAQGDTAAVDFGRGTIASRSMITGGGALRSAADKVIERGKDLAGHMMEASPKDIAFEDGDFRVVGTDKKLSIAEVAKMSFRPNLPPELGLGLTGIGDFLLRGFTFPNGSQVVEVEIDPETGVTTIVRLTSVDDVGVAINPQLLEGQFVGAIAQGLGQALMEDVAYEADSGQLLSGSFMDYAMPRAQDMPPIDFSLQNVPTKTNPLGVKGAGEAGTVGATPAIISAVLDALAPRGVTDIKLPASAATVWAALRQT
jgi:carbon-monoxide dehydrogenase large subunit